MQFRLYLIGLLGLASTLSLQSQDLSTATLEGTWQSTFSNPALMHRLPGRLTIGLPGLSNDFLVENFTYNDLASQENGQNVLRPAQIIPLLQDRNLLRDQFDFETIGVALRNKRLAVGFQHRIRYDALVDYPKTLAQLIWQGNAQFIGQTVEFAPRLQLNGYHELGFSAAFQLNERLSLGGRLKLLSGISNISTEEGGSLQLTTDEDNYALTLEQDYRINSAGALTYNDLSDITTHLSFANFTFDRFLGENIGLGFDLGASLDLGKLRFQAAAIDLGSSLEWKAAVNNYQLSGQSNFSGLDVLQDLLRDSTSFNGLLDSLEMQFQPSESQLAYRTQIGSSFLLGGHLDVNDRLTLGALLFYNNRATADEPAVLLSGRYQLLEALQLGATYAYKAGSATHLGVNATAQLGPVVLLLATDNVLTALRPKDSQRAHFRLGLSLSLLGDAK